MKLSDLQKKALQYWLLHPTAHYNDVYKALWGGKSNHAKESVFQLREALKRKGLVKTILVPRSVSVVVLTDSWQDIH